MTKIIDESLLDNDTSPAPDAVAGLCCLIEN